MSAEQEIKAAEESIDFYRRILVVALIRGDFDNKAEADKIDIINGLANDAMRDAREHHAEPPI